MESVILMATAIPNVLFILIRANFVIKSMWGQPTMLCKKRLSQHIGQAKLYALRNEISDSFASHFGQHLTHHIDSTPAFDPVDSGFVIGLSICWKEPVQRMITDLVREYGLKWLRFWMVIQRLSNIGHLLNRHLMKSVLERVQSRSLLNLSATVIPDLR